MNSTLSCRASITQVQLRISFSDLVDEFGFHANIYLEPEEEQNVHQQVRGQSQLSLDMEQFSIPDPSMSGRTLDND